VGVEGLPKNQIRTVNTIIQREHEDNADAKRVLLVDETGAPISDTNKLPVDATFTGDINFDFNGTTVNEFNEVLGVGSGIPTMIVQYIAPVGMAAFLQLVEATGTNIGEYEVVLNGTPIAKRRTYFSGGLDVEFPFSGQPSANGLELSPGDVVEVFGTHSRPMLGDFAARIQIVETPV